jgi:RHS repeat-associated protein
MLRALSPVLLIVLATLSVAALPRIGLAESGCSSCGNGEYERDFQQLPDEDFNEFRRALSLWSEIRQARAERDWPRMLAGITQLIDEFPGTRWEAHARALKGLHRKFGNDWDGALQEFNRVLALSPSMRLRHDVQSSIACMLYGRGRINEALDIFDQIRSETDDWDQKKYTTMWIRHLKKRKMAREHSRLDSCGAKSLAYVLQKSKGRTDEVELTDALAPYEQETEISLLVLRDAATKLGLDPTAVSISLEEALKLPLPLLALVKPGHYVVLVGLTADRIAVFNPERGEMTLTPDVLGAIWSGHVIAFGDLPAGLLLARTDPEQLAQLKGSVCSCCSQPLSNGAGDEPLNGKTVQPGQSCPGTGMPVVHLNTASFNWVVSDVDMTYEPSKGPAITFKRVFNNDSYENSIFGPGWTHSYGAYLEEFSSGSVQVTRGSGRKDLFGFLGGGLYDPPPGLYELLTKNANGSFTLESFPEKLVYHFSPDGKLAKIVDLNGNEVVLEYANNTPSVFGHGGGPGLGYFCSTRGISTTSEKSYAADEYYNRIQMLDAEDTAIAEWGSIGTGNGQFQYPVDTAVDAAGHVFVADKNNNRIQEFTADGVFVRKFGTPGLNRPGGVAVGDDGAIYVADAYGVSKYVFDGGLGNYARALLWGNCAPPTEGCLSSPDGLTVSQGFVFVADTYNHRIQKFTTEGVFVMGWGTYGYGDGNFRYPKDVGVAADGSVFVVDSYQHQIKKFDSAGLFLQKWGSLGDGPGQFNYPSRLTIDGARSPEEIVVADTNNSRFQRFDLNGGFISTFGQGGYAPGVLNWPEDVAVDGQGNRYVTDSNNHRVQVFSPNGEVMAVGMYGGANGNFIYPLGIAFHQANNVFYVADSSNRRIQKFSVDWPSVQFAASWPVQSGGVPRDVTTDAAGQVFVVNQTTSMVERYTADGGYLGSWGGPGTGNGQFNLPKSIAVDPDGNVWVLDQSRLQQFPSAGGAPLRVLSIPSGNEGLAIDGAGYPYVSGGSVIKRYSQDGMLMATWGTSGTLPGQFVTARGMTLDNGDNLYVVDSGNNRVQHFAAYLPFSKTLVSIFDAAGGRTALAYGPNLKVATVTAPDGSTAFFGYDQNNRLAASTDMANVTSWFTYTTYGDLSVVTTPGMDTGQVTYTIAYPSDITTTMTIDAPPETRAYTATMNSSANTIADPLGDVTAYRSSPWGAATHETDPLGGITQYLYDSNFERIGMIDAEGKQTTWQRDYRGRLTSLTNAANNVTTWVHNDATHVTTMTGPPPQSAVTVFQYDAQENLTLLQDPSGNQTAMTYDSFGRLLSLTSATNKVTTWAYADPGGTLENCIVTRTEPYEPPEPAVAVVLTRDNRGCLRKYVDELGRMTEYDYDGLGRTTLVRHPDGTERHYGYSCCAPNYVEDELGRRLSFKRNSTKSLTEVINEADPENPVSLMKNYYNLAGDRVGMDDTSNRRTDYVRDGRGWLTSVTYPGASPRPAESFTWFKNQLRKTMTDRMGRTSTYAYTPTGRLSSITFADGSKNDYTYDTEDRMISARTLTPGGAIRTQLDRTYTAAGRLETETQTLWGVARTFRYGYMPDGRLSWLRDETANPMRTTSYAWLDNGRLQTITSPDQEVFTFDYWDDGALRKKTYPSGAWAEYTYNSRGWLTSLVHLAETGTELARFDFTDGQGGEYYDDVGNRTAMNTANGLHVYTYDRGNLDRLLGADHPSPPDEAYTYDNNGNRDESAESTTWVYEPYRNELLFDGGRTFTSDGNGNRATKTDASGTTTYTYDYQNRLVRVDKPGGGFAEYAYDALGRRVRENVDGLVRLDWYSAEDMVLETDATGAEVARYTHGPGIDNPLTMRRNGLSYHYHEDPLGSIVLLTDATKAVVRSFTYDAFGKILAQTGTLENPYTYTSREWDTETGLYFYRARHYDPAAGRFLQVDPIEPRWDDPNPYVYVKNSPIGRIDAWGEHDIVVGGEVDAQPYGGIGFCAGIVIDTDDLLDSGLIFIGKYGPLGSGVNYSYGLVAQYYAREAEGYSAGLDANYGHFGGSRSDDANGMNSLGASIWGMGFGLSATEQKGWSVTLRGIWNSIKKVFE